MNRLLLIDAGNTRIKWAVARARGPIRPAGSLATKAATAASIRALAKRFPRHRAVLASVVPKLVPLFRRAFAGRIEIVSSSSPWLGLAFDYPKPAELGADRLAAAVAAHDAGAWPAIVVGCGTATAFTVLDAKGRLCGGAIAPGLETQLAALVGATAQLPATALRPARRALARSTREAVSAGVLLNFQGGAKEILRRLIGDLPGRKAPAIYLTGGHAAHLAGALGRSAALKPLLVFEGLRIMGRRILAKTL